MGEKDVPLIVFFFGIVIFLLIGSYTLIMHYDSISKSAKNMTNSSYSYFHSDKPFVQYMESYYARFTKRKSPTMRDIKSLIHSPKNSKPPDSTVSSGVSEPLMQNDNTDYIKKDKSQIDKSNKKDPVPVSDPFSPPEKKKKIENVKSKEATPVSVVPRKLQKRTESDHEENRATKPLPSIGFFVVVSLPAFVLIVIGIGLLVTKSWSDLFKSEKANDEFLDITGKRKEEFDIESGRNISDQYNEKSIVSSCMEGCTLVSRGNRKSKLKPKQKSKRRKKNRFPERKTVRFGGAEIMNYNKDPFMSLLNTSNPMITPQYDKKKREKRKKHRSHTAKLPKRNSHISLEEFFNLNK